MTGLQKENNYSTKLILQDKNTYTHCVKTGMNKSDMNINNILSEISNKKNVRQTSHCQSIRSPLHNKLLQQQTGENDTHTELRPDVYDIIQRLNNHFEKLLENYNKVRNNEWYRILTQFPLENEYDNFRCSCKHNLEHDHLQIERSPNNISRETREPIHYNNDSKILAIQEKERQKRKMKERIEIEHIEPSVDITMTIERLQEQKSSEQRAEYKQKMVDKNSSKQTWQADKNRSILLSDTQVANEEVQNMETEESAEHINAEILERSVAHQHYNDDDDDDLVPIGDGYARISAKKLKEIKWTGNYKLVTRQLMMAIFSRRVLATHSMSGKQSPAFQNIPAKKQLDPKLVQDIIKTVSEKMKVEPSLVRLCMTTKCTDEAKLYRMSLEKKKKNSFHKLH